MQPTTYQTTACAVAEGACAPVNLVVDAGPTVSPDAGSSASPPPSKGCGCSGADAGGLLGLALMLGLLAQRSTRHTQ